MKVYYRIFVNSVKSKSFFRADFLVRFFLPMLMIILRVNIWKALYLSKEVSTYKDVELDTMIAYCIISQFMITFIQTSVMEELNSKILSGEIVYTLLLPVRFIKHLLLESFANNIFTAVYYGMFPFAVSILLYGLNFEFSALSFFLFLISTILAFILHFFYSFCMGVSAVWLHNSFFLSNINEALFNLFSGITVPIWFFPYYIRNICYILPFRFMVFEPMTILLNKVSVADAILVLVMQSAWILLLAILSVSLWRAGQKKILIQGG